MKLIEMNIDKIIALCRKYKVVKLWVFGSILTPSTMRAMWTYLSISMSSISTCLTMPIIFSSLFMK